MTERQNYGYSIHPEEEQRHKTATLTKDRQTATRMAVRQTDSCPDDGKTNRTCKYIPGLWPTKFPNLQTSILEEQVENLFHFLDKKFVPSTPPLPYPYPKKGIFTLKLFYR